MAVKSNINIDQGTDFRVTVNVTDANNSPIVLTGYTGKAQFRKHYTSLTAYDFGVSISNGAVTLSLSSSNSNSISPGRYVYDCELTSTTGVKSRIVEGIVTVYPQVTKT
jgi:hypothetical protein